MFSTFRTSRRISRILISQPNMTDSNPGNDLPGGSGTDHEVGDDNKRTTGSSYNEDGRKLRALAGQWKTPPTPFYASTAQSQPQQQPAPATISSNEKARNIAAPANLPDNSEEYAKALQEAYRKGAEAAARMAQQQHLPSAASCPNFSTGSSQQPQPTSTSPSAPGEEATMAPGTSFHMNHQIHPPHQHQMSASIPDPLKSSMPPPLPPTANTTGSTIHHQQYPPQAQITYAPQHPAAEQQPFLQPQQSQPQQYTQQQPQMAVSKPVAAASVAQHPIKAAVPKQPKAQQPGRSLSMPDMSTYAAEAEEEKRLKRLARNRASARLRRLRKKNLVSTNEA